MFFFVGRGVRVGITGVGGVVVPRYRDQQPATTLAEGLRTTLVRAMLKVSYIAWKWASSELAGLPSGDQMDESEPGVSSDVLEAGESISFALTGALAADPEATGPSFPPRRRC